MRIDRVARARRGRSAAAARRGDSHLHAHEIQLRYELGHRMLDL
jgi:hypothetical protein